MTHNLRTQVHLEDILVEADAKGLKTDVWISSHQAEIEERLQKQGAVLIRGLKIQSSKKFGTALKQFFGDELINYTYRSTPRTELRGNVYTTTEYHADEIIPQHNENSYSNVWPLRLGFLCMLPAETGGETPIADSRVIYQHIPPEIRSEFEAKGVMYVRNYGKIDLPWSEVFQSEDPKQVEAYCQANQLEFEWKADGGLRTKQINPASTISPVTKEPIWFNQAHLFHISSLNSEARANLSAVMEEEDFPRNTYFGDGSPIDESVLDVIRKVYEDHQLVFSWQKNDLLLLNNMLFSHGRNTYTGPRKVLAGMATPYSHS